MQNTELRNLLWDMAKTICSEVAGTLEPAARERGLTMIQFRFLCEIHSRSQWECSVTLWERIRETAPACARSWNRPVI